MEKQNFEQIGQHLLSDQKFIAKLSKAIKGDTLNKSAEKIDLEELIEEVRQLLHALIQQQLQNQLKEIIEDNNKILKEIKDNITKEYKEKPIHQIEDVSFTQVHRIMDQQRKKITMTEDISDASLDKSISAFVELKVETIEEKVFNLDKRMKNMEQKYETNLKSIWNVLSITEGAIFDHLKQNRPRQCKQKSTIDDSREEKKSEKSFFGMFKMGK